MDMAFTSCQVDKETVMNPASQQTDIVISINSLTISYSYYFALIDNHRHYLQEYGSWSGTFLSFSLISLSSVFD